MTGSDCVVSASCAATLLTVKIVSIAMGMASLPTSATALRMTEDKKRSADTHRPLTDGFHPT